MWTIVLILVLCAIYRIIRTRKSEKIKSIDINFFTNPEFYDSDKMKVIKNMTIKEKFLLLNSDLWKYKEKQYNLLLNYKKKYQLIQPYLCNDVIQIIKEYNVSNLLPEYIEYVKPEDLIHKYITIIGKNTLYRNTYCLWTMYIISTGYTEDGEIHLYIHDQTLYDRPFHTSSQKVIHNWLGISKSRGCYLDIKYFIINNSIEELGFITDYSMIDHCSILEKPKKYKGVRIAVFTF